MLDLDDRPDLTLTTVNLSALDVRPLAYFYRDLLGWEVVAEEPEWILLRAEGGGVGLSVEHDEAFQRPVWPSRPGEQTLQVHLEIRVSDLDAAQAHALSLGASLADHQPQDDVRVCLDPAGHPFCLWLGSP